MAILYSDINANYGVDGKPARLDNIQSIEMSLENIMGTTYGERFFLPMFGSDILRIVHEPMNDTTVSRLLDSITDAIDRWEPRVTVRYDRSDVIADYDQNRYRVFITYVINGVGIEGTFRRDLLINTG